MHFAELEGVVCNFFYPATWAVFCRQENVEACQNMSEIPTVVSL